MLMSCRYTETEATASKSTGTGPAPPPSAQRELSNGTGETLRRWSALCLGLPSAYNGSTSLQRVTFTTYCKIQRTCNWIDFNGQSPKCFLGLTNSLSTSALRARLAEVHTAFIGNKSLFQGKTGGEIH